jgi:hypothetical protein
LVFDEFISINNTLKNNIVIKEILKNLTQDFYSKNLINTSYPTYKEFIDSKNKLFSSTDNKKLLENNNMVISKILPLYSDNSIDFSENALTDYKFINYVESIIETFNFTNNNPIGISKLSILDDFITNKSE